MTSSMWIVSSIAQWVVIAGLAVIVVGLVRQLGLVQLRLGVDPGVLITKEGLDRGAGAPDFEAPEVLTGQSTKLSRLRGSRVGIVFLTPTCLSCREIVPHLNEVARQRQGEVIFLAIMYGSRQTCSEFARRFKLQVPILADPTNAIAESYRVAATPFAYLLDERGLVLIRGVVNSWPQLEALLDEEGTQQRGEAPWEAESEDSAARPVHTALT